MQEVAHGPRTSGFERSHHLPAPRAHGPLRPSDLDAFQRWWSAISAQDRYSLFPRDFLWDNPDGSGLEWLYALPAGVEDSGGYETFTFPGGLWAVATCLDEGEEIMRTSAGIRAWLAQSDVVCEAPADEAPPRREMGHIVSPLHGKDMLGFRQMDIFVPVVLRNKPG